MTTWKDGGCYGSLYREITNEDGSRAICRVRVRHITERFTDIEPYPQGEADFRLILQAPQMAKALRAIAEGAIVSPDQPPKKIAEQTLRAIQLVREDNVKSLIFIDAQQKQKEQMLEALCSIRDTAECFLQPLPAMCTSRERWEVVRDKAVAAIAAVKGENDDLED